MHPLYVLCAACSVKRSPGVAICRAIPTRRLSLGSQSTLNDRLSARNMQDGRSSDLHRSSTWLAGCGRKRLLHIVENWDVEAIFLCFEGDGRFALFSVTSSWINMRSCGLNKRPRTFVHMDLTNLRRNDLQRIQWLRHRGKKSRLSERNAPINLCAPHDTKIVHSGAPSL